MTRIGALAAVMLMGWSAGSVAAAGTIVVGASQAKRCMDRAYDGARDRSAVDICTVALQEDSLTEKDRAGTLVNRGVIHMNRRDYAAALFDFEAAVALRPELGEAYFNRGSARIAQGRYREGVVDVERSLTLGMREPEKAYFNRALAREWLDDAAGAYRDYREAARLKPDWDLPRQELARFTVRR